MLRPVWQALTGVSFRPQRGQLPLRAVFARRTCFQLLPYNGIL